MGRGPASAPCCSCPLQVSLNGQRLPIKSFKDYVDLYVKDKEAPRVHERVNDRWEICICASEGQFQQVSNLQHMHAHIRTRLLKAVQVCIYASEGQFQQVSQLHMRQTHIQHRCTGLCAASLRVSRLCIPPSLKPPCRPLCSCRPFAEPAHTDGAFESLEHTQTVCICTDMAMLRRSAL